MGKNDRLIRGSPGNEVIHFRYNHKMECIFIKDIAFIKSDNSYSIMYRMNEELMDEKMICKSLKILEGHLKNYGFCRISRFFIVNTPKVDRFSSSDNKLYVRGIQLPVSIRKRGDVFPVLLEEGIVDIKPLNLKIKPDINSSTNK